MKEMKLIVESLFGEKRPVPADAIKLTRSARAYVQSLQNDIGSSLAQHDVFEFKKLFDVKLKNCEHALDFIGFQLFFEA